MINVDITPKGDIVLATPESEYKTARRLKLTIDPGTETADAMLFAIEEAVYEQVRQFMGYYKDEPIGEFYGIADEMAHFLRVEAINGLISKIKNNITDRLKSKGVVSFSIIHESKDAECPLSPA